MPHIPLICPRCGHTQRFVPGDLEHPARVVHEDTGREACEPTGQGRESPDPAPKAR
ncbi:hypothetical protein [Kitasatospora sp. MAP5-34]|uniref:hypothetical protein n=1 Tax=Kitasatospora sp. MAP5-34 TaxID=3035102 RepID=UPI002476F14B|nr:hypothetical protein [Kitasatospora sp. MAP5-34]MDH6576117.1 hypothetical protein [Kitasatospora sp. MAP5-34]